MDVYMIHFLINPPDPEPLLRIPVSDVQKYSSKPLKWIRYVTGAVLGAQGILSSLDGDDQDIDIEDHNPTCRILLFTQDQPIRFIDRDGLNHCKSSQFTTDSRTGFRFGIEERDERCVISGYPATFSEAAHLIPHSKGSEYIQALCRWRTHNEEPQIESINSVQNGIFVTPTLHLLMDRGVLTILRVVFTVVSKDKYHLLKSFQTPNFAMACEDVLPATNTPNNSFRFTPHYFLSEEDDAVRNTHPLDCRFPAALEEGWPKDWPPGFLLDFIYGVVVAKMYGVDETMDNLNEEPRYYPEGIKTATEKARTEIAQRKLEHDRKIEEQNKARRERANRDRGQQDFMDAFDKVFCFWMHHRFGRSGQEARAREEAEVVELEKTRQNAKAKEVTKWQEEVAEACDPHFYTSQSQTSTSSPSSPSSPSLLIQSSPDNLNLALDSST